MIFQRANSASTSEDDVIFWSIMDLIFFIIISFIVFVPGVRPLLRPRTISTRYIYESDGNANII